MPGLGNIAGAVPLEPPLITLKKHDVEGKADNACYEGTSEEETRDDTRHTPEQNEAALPYKNILQRLQRHQWHRL